MCALRSSSMCFTENRNMLRPVKSVTKTSVEDTTKRNMLLRAKKLSLDSDSFMKSLQGKYEHKEPKPPPVVGLGVRRYKGSRSCLGSSRDVPIDVEEPPQTNGVTNGHSSDSPSRKKSLANGLVESNLSKIREEPSDNDIEGTASEFVDNEEETKADLEIKLKEVDDEIKYVCEAMLKDDLDLDSLVTEPDSGTPRHHDAASNGDIAALKRLLKAGCDVNSPSEDGDTPLQLACGGGHHQAVRLLAKNGGDVGVIDKLGRSLLHTAVLGGQNVMVAALLEAGTRGDSRDTRRGRTPLHVAAVENELVMIKMLVTALKDDPWGSMPLLSITDKDGRTPLHVAAGKGSVEAVRLLLGVGFSVTCKDLYGLTPMHAALGLNHANKRCRLMLRLLLEAGGDLAIKEEHPTDGEDGQLGKHSRVEGSEEGGALPPSSSSSCEVAEPGSAGAGTDSRESAYNGSSVIGRRRASDAWVDEGVEHVERMIHMAARVGCGGCLALLIEYGAPVNSRDRRDRTPLHLTAESNRPNAARTLVRLGGDVDATDRRGLTPLHAAITADSPGMVEALLQLGADPDRRDELGRSYAEHALFSRKLEAFRSLIKQGVSAVGEEGSTILHSSASQGCLTSTELLIEMGWDCNVGDKSGLTPLHATIGQGHEDIATLLITEGANIMKRDNKGATPLHYAVRWGGSDALLRMLVKKGASLGAKDRLGRTPLHYAASKFSIMSDLYILLGGGADLNPPDISGLTPLHLAARLGNESLVRILLDKGANPLVKDMYNFTAYDHAEENKHASIMKRLKNYMASFTAKTNGISDSTSSSGGVGMSSVSSVSGIKDGAASSKLVDHSQSNGTSDEHSSGGLKGAAEVTQRSKQVGFQSRGHRTSIAW